MSVIGVHLEKTQDRHSRRTDNTMIEPSDQEPNTNMSANTDVTLHVGGSGSVPLGAGSVLHGGRSENVEDVVRSVQRGEEDPNRGTKSEVMVTLGRVLTGRASWEAGGSLQSGGKNNEDAGNHKEMLDCEIMVKHGNEITEKHDDKITEKHMMVVFDMRNTKDARERVDTTCEADQKRMMEKEDRG